MYPVSFKIYISLCRNFESFSEEITTTTKLFAANVTSVVWGRLLVEYITLPKAQRTLKLSAFAKVTAQEARNKLTLNLAKLTKLQTRA